MGTASRSRSNALFPRRCLVGAALLVVSALLPRTPVWAQSPTAPAAPAQPGGVTLTVGIADFPGWTLTQEVPGEGSTNLEIRRTGVVMAALAVFPVQPLGVRMTIAGTGPGSGSSSQGFSLWQLDVLYRVARGRITPYGAVGLGRGSESTTVSFGYLSAGAGVEARLRRSLGLNLEVDLVTATTTSLRPGVSEAETRLGTVRWQAGFQWQFLRW